MSARGRGGGRSGGNQQGRGQRGGGRAGGRDGGRQGGGGRRGGRGGGRGGGAHEPAPAPPSAPARTGRQAPPAAPAPPPAPARAEPRQQADVGALSQQLEDRARVSSTLVVPVVNTHFPPRPGFGTLGRAVKIHANHFKVNLKLQGDVYHYDVAMGEGGSMFPNEGPPKSLAQKIMTALMAELKRQFPQLAVVSDGRRNLYSPALLPFTEQAFNGLRLPDDGGRPREFTAVVKAADPVAVRVEQLDQLFQGRLNYTPYDTLQALDVAMRYTASSRFTTVGRNLYNGNGAKDIGEGAEVWFGYFQSLRATQSRLVVNLDLAATAFVQAMDVLDYVYEVLSPRDFPRSFNRPQHSTFAKAIRGVKVEITHRPGIKRSYRVNGLSPNGADQTFFEDENGVRMSVAQYFASAYNLRLQYPSLPCLHVGAPQKKNYMPMEVCRIQAGQKCPRKVTDKQVANMIKFTCTPPDQRKRSIEQRFHEAGFNTDPMLRAFGLEVDPKMVVTQGRQLPSPTMEYAGNLRVNPRDGAWNMRNKKFFNPSQLTSWAIINCCDPRRCTQADVQKFFKAVIKEMGELGMRCPPQLPPIVEKQGGPRAPIRNAFMQAVNDARKAFKTPPQLIWMINPTTDSTAYGDLKRLSDSEVGIVSQCMLQKHIQKCSPQYIANILMKVNTKLGGRNTVISGSLPKVSASRTIIFGADVTHPSPMDKTRPSIAAVVASMDANFIRHAASIRAQGHRVEQITNLKDMVVELMKNFYRETRGKPDRIVFYRDGVSEGQFHMVLNFEVTAIREACALLEPGYNPPITFVVVQKRHNTRLFPNSSSDADRSGNVRAGTVVDTGICHPIENDFYLMSHAGLQGTSRPTHYHVLLDEIGFTADELQTLTYRLCYTFARCTRSVSMVPSAYYSHLVAFRARFFSLDGSDTGSNFSAGSHVDTDTRMLEVHLSLKSAMFYV